MFLGLFFLLVLATAYAFALSWRLDSDADESTRGLLTGFVAGFEKAITDEDVRNMLGPCTTGCVQRLINRSAYLRAKQRWSIQDVRTFCGGYEDMRRCYKECVEGCSDASKPGCSILGTMLTATSVAIPLGFSEKVCYDNDANTGLLFCVREASHNAHKPCVASCRSESNRKSSARFGDVAILSADAYQAAVCSNADCIIRCIRPGVDQTCPEGGRFFIRTMKHLSISKRPMVKSYEGTANLFDFAYEISVDVPKACYDDVFLKYAIAE